MLNVTQRIKVVLMYELEFVMLAGSLAQCIRSDSRISSELLSEVIMCYLIVHALLLRLWELTIAESRRALIMESKRNNTLLDLDGSEKLERLVKMNKSFNMFFKGSAILNLLSVPVAIIRSESLAFVLMVLLFTLTTILMHAWVVQETFSKPLAKRKEKCE